MPDPPPAQLGNVNKALNAAQVDEDTEITDIGHNAGTPVA